MNRIEYNFIVTINTHFQCSSTSGKTLFIKSAPGEFDCKEQYKGNSCFTTNFGFHWVGLFKFQRNLNLVYYDQNFNLAILAYNT